jgi:acyl-CoA thioesterase FadM
MEKYALGYASQHAKTQQQTAVRSAHVSFYRPIFPAKGPVTMKLREVSVGKGWSTFRIELFQGDDNSRKVSASADITWVDPKPANLSQANSCAKISLV